MNKRIIAFSLIIFILYPLIAAAQITPEQDAIISVERIWDRAGHNAFTGMVEFNNKLYCSFREGSAHVYGINGSIRVIASDDGQNWYSVAHLYREEVDLRDPKLSITPDKRLMINIGGSVYEGENLLKMEPMVSFSDRDGKNFSDPQNIIIDDKIRSERDWLWRATWHEGIAYATVYQSRGDESVLQLVRSRDGITYELITTFELAGRPNETTLRFQSDGRMVALVRRESESSKGFIGSSQPPYVDWSWRELATRLGGPDLLILPDGQMIAGTRWYPEDYKNRMIIAKVTPHGSFRKMITLPSGGDCSYPALVVNDNILYVSYYSSHEEKTSIYLARIWLDRLQKWMEMEELSPPFVKSDKNGLVSLANPDKNAEIRYTLDGSDLTQSNGLIYQSPFKVTKTTRIKMRSFHPGKFASETVTTWIGTDVFLEAPKVDLPLEPGLRYRYYEGKLGSVKDITSLTENVSGITARITTDERRQDEYFAFQFDGYISIPEDGLYYFYLLSNDGSQLSIDDDIFLDNDGSHAAREISLAASLKAGKHKIRLHYFQLGGAQSLKLLWKGPHFDREEIPADVFFH